MQCVLPRMPASRTNIRNLLRRRFLKIPHTSIVIQTDVSSWPPLFPWGFPLLLRLDFAICAQCFSLPFFLPCSRRIHAVGQVMWLLYGFSFHPATGVCAVSLSRCDLLLFQVLVYASSVLFFLACARFYTKKDQYMGGAMWLLYGDVFQAGLGAAHLYDFLLQSYQHKKEKKKFLVLLVAYGSWLFSASVGTTATS